MNFSPFSCSIFLGHQEARGRCSQGKRVLMGGLVPFGRNRESRTRDDAGRRNWPEAMPRKMRGRKRKRLRDTMGIVGRAERSGVIVRAAERISVAQLCESARGATGVRGFWGRGQGLVFPSRGLRFIHRSAAGPRRRWLSWPKRRK